ncbi:MAG: hypothetical protein ACSHX0_06890 [Akkermansiaceae bacterium]
MSQSQGGSKVSSIVTGGSASENKTDDVRLAAALLTVGVSPLFKQVGLSVVSAIRPGNWQEFYFEAVSRCGRYQTGGLIAAWREGLGWIDKNPDHPFAYAMASQANHRDLRRYLAKGDEMAFLTKGRSVAMLPMNASAAMEEKILGKW